MVVAAFPAAKLGALILRQVSKPIANIVKERAKRSYFFRTYVCMPPAQFYHWCEVKLRMWAMNLGKPVQVPQLNENMAIELGANLLGEAIVFSVAVGVLLVEYNRSSRKEREKEEERVNEIRDMHDHIRELAFVTETQRAQIQELTRRMYDVQSKGIFAKKAPLPPELEEVETVVVENKHPVGKVTEALHYLQHLDCDKK